MEGVRKRGSNRVPTLVAGLIFLVIALSLMGVQVALAAPFTWSNIRSMGTTRMNHTATLLPNGKVLVVGGHNGVSYLASCELYNPATESWSPTGSLAIARGCHTATLLADGRVLVMGGYANLGSPYLCELYDPATGTWANNGEPVFLLRGYTATLLPNGKVLVAGGGIGDGGSSGGTTHTSIYDPISGIWNGDVPQMLFPRAYHTATPLPNGQILMAGGFNEFPFMQSSNSAELFDPVSGTWAATGFMTSPHAFHTATLLPNGQVLVKGGFVYVAEIHPIPTLGLTDLYDPATGIWATTDELDNPTVHHTATLLPNGQVLTAGGATCASDMGPSCIISRANIYDLTAQGAYGGIGGWSPTGSLATVRGGHTATLLGNGKVLVAGGWAVGPFYEYYENWHDPSLPLASAELYISAKFCSAILELLLE